MKGEIGLPEFRAFSVFWKLKSIKILGIEIYSHLVILSSTPFFSMTANLKFFLAFEFAFFNSLRKFILRECFVLKKV
jgi:hypothetical protein